MPEPTAPSPTTVPVYDAGPGNHRKMLDTFLAQNGEWERYRPHDETTIASHETLLMRVEFVHEPEPGEPRWTVAVYESPVGERRWHATATASTPVEMVVALLDTLAPGTVGRIGPAADEKSIEHVGQSLTGWTQVVEEPFIRWSPPRGNGAGVVFDAFAAQARLPLSSETWTIWGGGSADSPVWVMHLSAHTPAEVLHDIAVELAEAVSRRPRPGLRPAPAQPDTAARPEPPAPAVTPPTHTHRAAGPRPQTR